MDAARAMKIGTVAGGALGLAGALAAGCSIETSLLRSVTLALAGWMLGGFAFQLNRGHDPADKSSSGREDAPRR
jgi:hypothetical protein